MPKQTQQTEQASREGRLSWEKVDYPWADYITVLGDHMYTKQDMRGSIRFGEYIVGHEGGEGEITTLRCPTVYHLDEIMYILQFKRDLDKAGIPYKISNSLDICKAAKVLRGRAEELNQAASELENL